MGRWVEFFGEALDLAVDVVAASDSKPAAAKFIGDNWSHRVKHCYDDMESLGRGGGHCLLHDGTCKIPGLSITDFVFTGMPCQAWTRNRTRDSSQCSPADHSGWKVTFAKFFGILDSSLIKINGGIAENVMGFADEDTRSGIALKGHKSPYHLFVAELRSRGYVTKTFRLDMAAWLDEPPRERLYVVWISEALGGMEALRWIERTVKDPWPRKAHVLVSPIPPPRYCFMAERLRTMLSSRREVINMHIIIDYIN